MSAFVSDLAAVESCKSSKDGTHCRCWWDGKACCCWCGSNEGEISEVSE